MNAMSAQALALELLDEHLLTDWVFKFDKATVRFGSCNHRKKIISLSRKLTEANDLYNVNDTLLHEIAHALVGPRHGHDRVWRAKCREIGGKPDRCYSAAEVVQVKGKYVATCVGCNRDYFGYKKRKRLSACADCCTKYSGGRFDHKYALHFKEIQ